MVRVVRGTGALVRRPATVLVVSFVVVLLLLLVLLAVWGLRVYVRILRLRVQVDEGWSLVEVEMARRAALVPALLEVVREWAVQEAGTLSEVAVRRAQAVSRAELLAADAAVASAVNQVFAAAEAFPQLRASAGFLRVHRELVDAEDMVAARRGFFIERVGDLNAVLVSFPAALVAGLIGARPERLSREGR